MSKTYISAALRRLVRDQANYACEYCLIPEMAQKNKTKSEAANINENCYNK